VPVEYKKREYEGVPAEDREWEGVIEDILARVHSYRVRSRIPGVRPRFVDRDPEIKRILSDPSVFGHGMVTVLYGPKGCGKTELFRALAESVDPGRHRLVVARAKRELKREEEGVVELVRLYAPGGVLEKLGEVLGTLLRRAQVQSPAPVPISIRGEDVGYAALALARAAIAYRAGIGKVVAVADEASARNTNIFKDWVEDLADTAAEYAEKYAEEGADFSVVVLTSDAVAAKLTDSVGDKVNWVFMWNLPREAAENLAGQLGAVGRASRELGVGREEARELLWRLAGGNPRDLDTIAEKGVISWLSSRAAKVVVTISMLEGRIGGRLWGALGEVLDSVDSISRHEELYNTFLSKNMIISFVGAEPISPLPREPWVGRWYAFQVPAYYYALRAVHRKRSLEIGPGDILEEAMRG